MKYKEIRTGGMGMGYFAAMAEHGYEELVMVHDRSTGLRAAIAIHSTLLGPALGGTRMWKYASEEAAIEDVLRLARGMTYKAAAAELPLGGGKGVIMGDPSRDKTEALLRAYARAVEKLGGRFITAEDMGTDERDMDLFLQETSHVASGSRFGSPSPYTAFGVWNGIKACVREVYGTSNMEGLTVAVQGLGGVGRALCGYLAKEGTRLLVTDLDRSKLEQAVRQWGCTAVEPEKIYEVECDLFSPCGSGGAINDNTIERLRCRIVAGSANNMLLRPEHGRALFEKGILYAPDYVINAGGLIFVESCRRGAPRPEAVYETVGRIEDRLQRVFKRSREEGLPPETVVDHMVEEQLQVAAKEAS